MDTSIDNGMAFKRVHTADDLCVHLNVSHGILCRWFWMNENFQINWDFLLLRFQPVVSSSSLRTRCAHQFIVAIKTTQNIVNYFWKILCLQNEDFSSEKFKFRSLYYRWLISISVDGILLSTKNIHSSLRLRFNCFSSQSRRHWTIFIPLIQSPIISPSKHGEYAQ